MAIARRYNPKSTAKTSEIINRLNFSVRNFSIKNFYGPSVSSGPKLLADIEY